jgi:hypothetical protein
MFFKKCGRRVLLRFRWVCDKRLFASEKKSVGRRAEKVVGDGREIQEAQVRIIIEFENTRFALVFVRQRKPDLGTWKKIQETQRPTQRW